MKNLITLSTLAFVLYSCGGGEQTVQDVVSSGDLEAIRAKRKELNAQQQQVNADIQLLDSAINANTENTNLPLVTALELKQEEFQHFIELQGDVTTDQNVLVYPEVAGTILTIHVKEGQKVTKGQLLATIDNGGMSNQLAQMETQLALAKTTFERQERLWGQKIGTEIQYLQAKTNYEAQDNAVSQMKIQLGKYTINAPFAGVIDDVVKDEGTVIAPGGPGSEVFRIINLKDMYVDVLVPENYLTTITKGKSASVFFPVLGQTIESTVGETGNFINPANRTFIAKINVPNAGNMIKPNLTARVKLNDYSSDNAVLVPQSIISENAEGEQYVYTVVSQNGTTTVAKKIIKTGLNQEGQVEILEGLKAGDKVIVEGARSVRDGQEVKILKG